MREFMYAFQVTKMVVFEVKYYTLSTNSHPYFTTSAKRFIRSKMDFNTCGQCQEEVLPHCSKAYRFYKKWNHCHLHDLTEEEYEGLLKDIEGLKAKYNYIEDVRDKFGTTTYKTDILFSDIKDLSKLEPKYLQKKAS